MNHSPLRFYYIYRNDYLLYKEDKKFYKIIHKNNIKEFIKTLLVNSSKIKYYSMRRKGIKHAKKNLLGPYVDAKK